MLNNELSYKINNSKTRAHRPDQGMSLLMMSGNSSYKIYYCKRSSIISLFLAPLSLHSYIYISPTQKYNVSHTFSYRGFVEMNLLVGQNQ